MLAVLPPLSDSLRTTHVAVNSTLQEAWYACGFDDIVDVIAMNERIYGPGGILLLFSAFWDYKRKTCDGLSIGQGRTKKLSMGGKRVG